MSDSSRQVSLDPLRLTLALSAINTGLSNVERGRVELGAKGIREGVEFLRSKIKEAS
jgi:hypothetical protein